MYSYNIKHFPAIVLLTVIISAVLLFSQNQYTKKKILHSAKNNDFVELMIRRAERYEKSLDYNRSYSVYRSLMRTNSTDDNVLNGFVKNSVKTNIKKGALA